MSTALPHLVSSAGFVPAVLAHFGIREDNRRGHERYQQIVGDYGVQVDDAGDPWRGIRQNVGRGVPSM